MREWLRAQADRLKAFLAEWLPLWFGPRDERLRRKAARRLRKLDKGYVLDHLDAAMSGAWKATEDFRKDELAVYLDEAERGLQQALGAVDALKSRRTA